MTRTTMLTFLLALPLALPAQNSYDNPQEAEKAIIVRVDTSREPIQKGKYKPTWESLSDYECPAWFRDAKFGIWAHWGPQCQPEYGDWFARRMYEQGSDAYTFSKEARNPQKDFGFKDWIREWKAERWDPERLVKLYQDCGARYFFALANHHDNFDLWDSKYQPWNAVSLGPQKNIIAGWAAACRKLGMPLGLSVHAAHAWTWYETARGADTSGTFKGQPYDGCLTKADGKGTWWDGLDPQDLYEQRHTRSKNNGEWDWNPTQVTLPDQAYCDRFYNRTMDLINKYDPSVVYFDDTVLPLYPFSDAGLQLTAHLYNKSMARNGGRNEIVVTGKVLKEWHKKALMWDVERGTPDRIQPQAWQTCTCIGSWHYDKRRFFDGTYKTAQAVIQTLVDVVSKNGNLLLSVPVKGDGTIDSLEYKVVCEVGTWLKANGESIYGTRPWVIFGEGPAVDSPQPLKDQGFNEGKVTFTSADIRYVTKGKTLYATTLCAPQPGSMVTLKAVKKARRVSLLGHGKVAFRQTKHGLSVTLPATLPNQIALVMKIE
ncbi:alpha-L-fucosidase [Segatella maculosa]|uniref:alpha-L-fucosidase n=1 Tax=Segatella maculosa TaxID=439703 RepID=UPI0030B8C3CA